MEKHKKDELVYAAIGITIGVIFTHMFSWFLQNWESVYLIFAGK